MNYTRRKELLASMRPNVSVSVPQCRPSRFGDTRQSLREFPAALTFPGYVSLK
jgi:hypothetical protein